MAQKPFSFRNKGQLVAGTLHLPRSRGPFPAVLILHGFSGDRCGPHFIFTRLSRRLAREGIASLRFDFRGSGESEGGFEDMTALEEVSDARAAMRRLAAVAGVDRRRIGIVGHSFGGLIAALTAGKEPAVRSLVLWAAVARPVEVFLREATGRGVAKLERDGRLDSGGLYIGLDFLRTIRAIDPATALAAGKAQVLIIHGAADTSVPYVHSTDYLRAAKARGIRSERLRLEGANHNFTSVPAGDAVIEATVEWFEETLA